MKQFKRVLVAMSAVAAMGLCQCTTTEVGSVGGDGGAEAESDPDKRYEAALDREFRAMDTSVYP